MNRSKLGLGFAFEVRIKRFSYDSDKTAEILGAQLVDVASDFTQMSFPVTLDSVPLAFHRQMESWVVGFFRYCIQDTRLEKRLLKLLGASFG